MGPYKCPDCGVWWAGLEHRCARPFPDVDTAVPWIIRPYAEPSTTGGTTSAPWCGICQGWHIPGAGPCTATYSFTTVEAVNARLGGK
jgi:hypothetical protein